MIAIARCLVLLAAVTGLLAACGKVGPVEPPPESDAAYPRVYPPPDSVVPPPSDEGGDTEDSQ